MAGKLKHIDKSDAIYDFYKIYAQKVAPILQEMEASRKKQLTELIVISLLLFLGSLLFLFLDDINYFYIVLFIAISLIFIIWNFLTNDFVQQVKKKCMPLLLQAFGDISWHKKETGSSLISDFELKNSELFADYNKREDDDAFDGCYKGVNFSVVETHLFILTEGRRKMYWKVFKGAIIKFDSNKTIRNKTIITTKGDINTRNNNPLLWLIVATIILLTLFLTISDPGFAYSNYDPMYLVSNPMLLPVILIILGGLIFNFFNKPSEKLNPIKLEDPEFNKRYKMYSSDEIEGRYLVTTAFMQRFKNLHTSFGSKNAKCSFLGNTIIFSIPTNKNLFEIGSLFFPLTDQRQINTFLEEISAIYDLIDYFKLDEKTGL